MKLCGGTAKRRSPPQSDYGLPQSFCLIDEQSVGCPILSAFSAERVGGETQNRPDPVLLCHPERNRIVRAASDSVESKDPASARRTINSQAFPPIHRGAGWPILSAFCAERVGGETPLSL